MAFKINVSHNGKTHKVETESEVLVGKKIGEGVKGEDVDESLKGYELEITGTSDLSGIPGFRGLEGSGYHRRLLTHGLGMKDTRKGIRLRKSNRGEEISLKTHQINIKVVKEGDKKFEGLVGKKVEGSGEGDSTTPESNTEQNELLSPIKSNESPTHQSPTTQQGLYGDAKSNSMKDEGSESGNEDKPIEEEKVEAPVDEKKEEAPKEEGKESEEKKEENKEGGEEKGEEKPESQ